MEYISINRYQKMIRYAMQEGLQAEAFEELPSGY